MSTEDRFSVTSLSDIKGFPSRRSIDWRDSGCVIDYPFNSIESICSPEIIAHARADTNTTCPLESLVLHQDEDGDTILHLAVVGCSLDQVKDLIKICDLNAINNMMQTPLHVATLANRLEMVELLIQSGASLIVHDCRGNTPLHLACQKGYKDIATAILRAMTATTNVTDTVASLGPQTNTSATIQANQTTVSKLLELTNFDGLTCLHLAATNNEKDVIKLLVVEFGADINCRDSRSGETIMHKAITKYQVDLVAFICSLDNFPIRHCNAADFSGRRPLDTINLFQNSKIDSDQYVKLNSMSNLIRARIESCIKSGGCCESDSLEITNSRVRAVSSGEQTDSSASSSYSDSDTDMAS